MNKYQIGTILYPTEEKIKGLRVIKGHHIGLKRVIVEINTKYRQPLYRLRTLSRLNVKTNIEYEVDEVPNLNSYFLDELDKYFIVLNESKIIYPDE